MTFVTTRPRPARGTGESMMVTLGPLATTASFMVVGFVVVENVERSWEVRFERRRIGEDVIWAAYRQEVKYTVDLMLGSCKQTLERDLSMSLYVNMYLLFE